MAKAKPTKAATKPKPSLKPKSGIFVDVDPDLRDSFNEAIKKRALNRSEVFRQWIRNFIETGSPDPDK